MARIRYGIPFWLDRVPPPKRPVYPKHKGDVTTDVVIVGAGLAGCMAAYAFRRAGVKVIVLEAGRVGQQSAASLGWLPESPGVPFRELQEAHGLRAARRIWEASRRSALDAAALLRRLGIRCELERAETVVAARDAGEAKRLEREHQARTGAGLDAAWLNARKASTDTKAEHVAGAIRTGHDAVCDPYRACLGLAAAAAKAGAAIHEQSAVVKVKAGRKQVEVRTAASVITAKTVVMATNDPGPGCGALRRHVRISETYVAATTPLTGPLLRAVGPHDAVLRDANGGGSSTAAGRDHADPPHTLRHTKDGRILFQGADQKPVSARLRDKAIVQRTGQLMYELSRLYPAISGTPPDYGWSARTVTATDGLLLAGPHRNFPRHLFAIGLGATGISGAYLAARIVLRHYEEAVETGDDLFGFSRVQPVRS